jgi:hypothetical protein
VKSVTSIESCLTAPFLVMFAFGFFYVSVMSLLSERTLRHPRRGAAAGVKV